MDDFGRPKGARKIGTVEFSKKIHWLRGMKEDSPRAHRACAAEATKIVEMVTEIDMARERARAALAQGHPEQLYGNYTSCGHLE